MSYSKKSRMFLAVGLFLVLSTIVFGTIFYVALSASNVEIVVSGDDAGNRINEVRLQVNEEYIISTDCRIRRGPIEMVPDYNPYLGIGRGPIELLPDFNPFFGHWRGPIEVVPI